jgi:hypothetical protein
MNTIVAHVTNRIIGRSSASRAGYLFGSHLTGKADEWSGGDFSAVLCARHGAAFIFCCRPNRGLDAGI